MIILKQEKINRKIEKSVENYQKRLNYGSLRCPCCQSSSLIRWGNYERYAIYLTENNQAIKVERLKVQRFRCKDCGKTHGILPEGLIPYKQFSTDIIVEALINADNCQITNLINYISLDTIKKWKRQFNKFYPYLVTMFREIKKIEILRKIRKDIMQFYEQFFKENQICFMQIKLLYLNLCPS